jgi:hypothetical protein
MLISTTSRPPGRAFCRKPSQSAIRGEANLQRVASPRKERLARHRTSGADGTHGRFHMVRRGWNAYSAEINHRSLQGNREGSTERSVEFIVPAVNRRRSLTRCHRSSQAAPPRWDAQLLPSRGRLIPSGARGSISEQRAEARRSGCGEHCGFTRAGFYQGIVTVRTPQK